MEVPPDAEDSSDFTRDFSIEDIDTSLTRCGLLPEQAEGLLLDRSAALRTQIRMLYCPICGDIFDTDHGVKIHAFRSHDTTLAGYIS